MAFAERFEEKLRADGTDALIEMLHGGFAFDQVIGGETCAVRRIRDRRIRVGGEGKGPEDEWLETDFFIFPQNGQKDKLMTGVVMTVMSRVEDFEREALVFTEPEIVTIYRPQKPEIYYAQVASRGGRLIGEAGPNTYLRHDVMITTPEKEIVPLENFDFEAHKLFMLGLYGGEYKVGIAEKPRKSEAESGEK